MVQCLVLYQIDMNLFGTVTLSFCLLHSLIDVVLEGRVTRSRKGEFGTYNANVSYSRALKHDGQLARVSLDKVEIVNVHFDATQPEYNMNAIFFLIRQQNADLALHCMTPDEALWSTYQQQYKHKSDLLNHIEQVGEGMF